MLIDATDRFLDRMAATVATVNKKEGLFKGALRMAHLPVDMRVVVQKKVASMEAQYGARR